MKVVPGDSAEFIAIVHANPPPDVIWTKDGQIVKENDNVKIIEDVDTQTYKLIFNKVSLSDEGRYKITAKNQMGETSSEAILRTVSEYFFIEFLYFRCIQLNKNNILIGGHFNYIKIQFK